MWQPYIDDHLTADIEGNHLTSAAIVGHDGNVWAQSSNFPRILVEILNGHSNPFVRIIGLQLAPVLFESLSLSEPEEVFLHYSPMPVSPEHGNEEITMY